MSVRPNNHTISILMFLFVLMCTQQAAAQIGETSYSYMVKTFEGDVFEDSDSQLLLPLSVSPSADIFSMEIKANSLGSGYTRLKAKASISADVNSSDSPQSWESVGATAKASSRLVAPAAVINVGQAQRGFVHFSWLVGGYTDITLETGSAHLVGVDVLGVLTTLKSNTLTFAEPRVLPWIDYQLYDGLANSSGDDYRRFRHSTPGVLNAFIIWDINQPVIPVDFELETTAIMSIKNIDSSAFKASVSSDFSNTATLQSVVVLDDAGISIPGAALALEDGSFVFPVPEPSTGLIAAVLSVAFTIRRRRAR